MWVGRRRLVEEILFQAAAFGEIWAARTGNRPLQLATKPVAVPLLALKAFRRRGELRPGELPLLTAGLAAAGVGDYYMSRSDDDSQIICGAVAFGAMQLLYSGLLWRRGNRFTGRTAVVPAAAWAAATGILAIRRGHTGPGVPVTLCVYAGTLAATLSLAQDPRPARLGPSASGFVRPTSDRRTWLAGGAVLFALSDTAILIRRSLLTDERVKVAAQTFVLSSYNIAQWLIVEGFLSQGPWPLSSRDGQGDAS